MESVSNAQFQCGFHYLEFIFPLRLIVPSDDCKTIGMKLSNDVAKGKPASLYGIFNIGLDLAESTWSLLRHLPYD